MSNLHYMPHTPIEPPPVVSSAPAWEALSKVASGFEDMAANQAMKAKQAAILANKYNLGAEINQAATDAYIKSQNLTDPHASLKLFNGLMDNVGKRVLSNALPANKAYLRNLLVSHTNEGNLHFATKAHQVDVQNTQASLMEKLNTYSNQANVYGYNDNKPKALSFHAQTLNILDDMVKAGYSPERAAIYRQSFNKQFYTNSILGEYKSAKTAGVGAGYKSNFGKIAPSKYGGILGQKGIQNIYKGMQGIDKEFALQDGLSSATFTQHENQMLYAARHGQPLDQKILGDMAAAFPEKYNAFVPKLEDAHTEYVNFNADSQGDLATQQATLAELKTELPNIKDLRSYQIAKNVHDRLQERLNMLNTDPVGVIKNDPTFQRLYQQKKDLPGFTQSGFIVTYQKDLLGIPDDKIHVMDNAQAKNIAGHIEGIDDPTQKSIALSEAIGRFPPSVRPYVIKDLQRNGLSQASQYLYRTYKDPKNIQYLTSMGIAFKTKMSDYYDDFKKRGITKTAFENGVIDNNDYKNWISVLTNTQGDINQLQSDFDDKHQRLAAQLLLEGKVSTPEDAGQLSAQILNGGMKFDSYGGAEIAYPSNISDNTMDDALSFGKYIYGQAKDVQIPPILKINNPGLTNDQYKAMLQGGMYYKIKSDQSALILSYMDGTPVRVGKETIVNGKKKTVYQPIQINFRELRNKQSDFYKRLLEFNQTKTKAVPSLFQFAVPGAPVPPEVE